MSWILPAVIATMAGTGLLVLVFWHLYRKYRERHLLLWTIGWLVYLCRFAFQLAVLRWGEQAWLLAGNHLCTLVSGLLILEGAYLLVGTRPPRSWRAGAALTCAWVSVAVFLPLHPFRAMALPTFLFTGAIYIWTGRMLVRYAEEAGSSARWTGWAFIVWGVHKLDYPVLRPVAWFAPWGYLLGAVLELGVAIGILLIYFERLERELGENEEKYRTLVEGMPDGVAIVRGNTIVYANPALAEITGARSPDELLGRSFTDFVAPEDRGRMVDYGRRREAGEDVPTFYGFTAIADDGTRRDAELSVRGVHYGGQPARQGVIRDVTERRRLELELNDQRVKAVQVDRLKALGEMAAGVAHELNQPLTTIVATAEGILLRREIGVPVSDEDVARHMESIVGMVERMSQIIDHMRLFSRDRSGDPPEAFTLSGAAASALTFVGAQLREHGIQVHTELPEDLPPCWGKQTEVEQVFLNLVGNARDALDARAATAEAGWSPRLEIVTVPGRDHDVVAEVRDNGGGVDEVAAARIFEPFYTTKSVGKGTGLGLSISRGIVEKHGGQLELLNRPGEGATFRLSLPVADERPPGAATGGGAGR